MMRDPDYTEVAELLAYLCTWLRGRLLGHRPRHACRWWRLRSTVQRSRAAEEAQRLGVVAWVQSAEYERLNLPRFGVFEPVPDYLLPAPVSPPMYPAVEVPRRLALGWREETDEIPVARIGRPIPVGVA